MKFSFTVPGNPKPKARPRVTRNGTFTPSDEDEKALSKEMFGRMRRFALKPVDDSLRVELDFYRSDRRRVDLDNLQKLVLDAGNRVLWKDDSLIAELESKKYIDKENPRTEIRVFVL